MKITLKPILFIRTGVIIFTAFLSALLFFIYLNQHIIFNKAAGGNGSLTFTQSKITVKNGNIFETELMMNTDQTFIRGTDIRIKFDPSHIKLIDIVPKAQEYSTLKTFTPLQYDVFNRGKVIREANKTGIITFGAVTADLTAQTVTQPFKGMVILSHFIFQTIQPGQSTLSIIHNDPLRDSTIINDGTTPQNILLETNELAVTAE